MGAALAVASAVAAADWRTTTLGHADRHLGLLGLFSLFVAGFCGLNLSAPDRRVVRCVLEGAAVIIGFHATVQAATGDGRATGTFGSPTYAGGALALALPFVLDRAATVRRPAARAIGWAGASVVFTGLLSTGARGAWLAGIVGAGGVGWMHRRRISPRAAAAVAVGLVTVGSAVAIASEAVRDRLASITDPTTGSGGGRLTLWRAGLDAALARPLLGWGPERTRVGLPPELPRSFEQRSWDQLVPDRAHNAVLDTAITVGAPATILFVGLMGASLVVAARRELGVAAATSDGRGVWVVASVGYAPFLLVNFVQLEVDLAASLIFGVAVSAATVEARPRRIVRLASAGAGAAVMAAGAVYAAGLVVADTSAERGLRAERSGQLDAAGRWYERARGASFGEARYAEIVARFDQRTGDWDGAIEAADAAAAMHPGDPFFGELAAQTRSAAAGGDPARADQAAGMYRDLIRRWPNHGAFHNGLGVVEARRGNVDAARGLFETAIALSPLSDQPFENLARLLLAEGEPDAARLVLDQGIERVIHPARLVTIRDSLEPGT